jgi:hypothetical protein
MIKQRFVDWFFSSLEKEFKDQNKKIEKLEKKLEFLDGKIDMNIGIDENIKWKVYRVIEDHFPDEIHTVKLRDGSELKSIVTVSPKHWERVDKYIKELETNEK